MDNLELRDTYGTAIFIGREDKISLFEKLLDDPDSSKWILSLCGVGGTGKTQLLRRFAEIARRRESVLVTRDLVDLYWTTNQRELGILKAIAEQLAPERFKSFYTALGNYQNLLAQAEPDSSLVRERADRARASFLEAYGGLDASQVVLLFDTAEIATDAIARFWREILPRLKKAHRGTLVVVAGRQCAPGLPDEYVMPHELAGLSIDEVSEYFRQSEIAVPVEIVTRVAELSEGRPILVALTADWIKFGENPQELIAYRREEFEQAMVERVMQLRFPADRVIMAMAHLYRRFNEEILAYVLGQEPAVSASLTQSLSRLSFVKYRPPIEGKVGSCTLHDEMRDLIKRYVLPIIDSVGMYRQGLSKTIIKYYEERVESTSDQAEKQNLSLERLFYWLDTDIQAAFDYSGALFSGAMDRYDTDFMEAINSEIEKRDREKALPPALHREAKFREGAVMLRRERYPEAIRTLTGLLEDPACEPALQASARARLVESYAYSGDPQKAIELGLESEQWFDKLLGDVKLDDRQRRRMDRDFGWLCNSLGLAYRSQNRLDQTVEYYNKALNHFANIDGAQSQIASTKNNLGYVYHRLARDDEALSECETALRIRQKLGSPDQLGYSYNVLGMIRQDQARGEEAIDWFERALHAFREADSERGQALVYVSYGRLMRQWGLLMERQADGKCDAGCQQYQKAQDMLDNAIMVFRQINDRSNLSEALNEKGTLLRQQRRWDEAIKCFDESADLARQIGNQYREVDSLQDLGVLYYSIEQLDQAQSYSQQAADLAKKMGSNYLFARAQRTVANIMFKRGDFNHAFEVAGDALVYFVKLDPEASSYKIAKREIFYDEWLDWICEQMILGLPSHELSQRYAGYLIGRWEQETSGGQRLADSFPGVIPRIRDFARNYPFLTAQQ